MDVEVLDQTVITVVQDAIVTASLGCQITHREREAVRHSAGRAPAGNSSTLIL